MDTLTHGIVGALIGKAFFADDPLPSVSWRETPKTPARVAIISATLGAIFPDIDVFAGPLAHNSLAIMTWHRNITHSLLMLAIWAVLLAALTTWLAHLLRWPAPRFNTLFVIYAVGLGSHIFLDVITSFGTMVWSPINYARPAWDWLFLVDVTATSLALVPQLAAWAFRKPERAARRTFSMWILTAAAVFALGPIALRLNIPFSAGISVAATALLAIFFLLPLRRGAGSRMGRAKWCRTGIALFAAYLSFAGAMHHLALQQVTSFAEQGNMQADSIAVLPLPPSPGRWQGLMANPRGVYRVQFDEFGDEPFRLEFFPQAASNRYVEAARQLREVQTYLWFARFPLFTYSEATGQPVVQISDLRFARTSGRTRMGAAPTRDATNFTFQVVFSKDGRVLSRGFLRSE